MRWKRVEMQFALAGGRGFLRVQEEGGKIHLYGELPEDGQGIYKGRIQGAGGGNYLAGTFLPEGRKLCLRRVVSRETLNELGVWPVTGAEAVLAFSRGKPGGGEPVPTGWTRLSDLPARLGDPLLRRAAEGVAGALIRPVGEGVEIAVPFTAGGRFHLTPLFCLMWVWEWGGARYASVRLDKRGWPITPKDRPGREPERSKGRTD
ncbi:hypothetical protein [Pseudoflavonifractor gallinarum]|uniref:hypothetical protein n=1 Tax=Pseudoflavonifractor gallinarum TaxID=2779352 RepID=UPI0036F24E6B